LAHLKDLLVRGDGRVLGNLYANVIGNATTATKLQTARTISLTGDINGSGNFDGSSNISIAVAVANDSHSHSTYLPLAGGTMTGPIVFGTASGNNKTSNYISAGGGYSTGSGLYGLKLLALNQSDAQMGLGADLTGLSYECCLSTGRANDSTTSYITFATHNSGASTYKQLGYF
jgi:hypothetical protein